MDASVDSKDLPNRLSAAILQFCQDNIQYGSHLTVNGNITIVTDGFTLAKFGFGKIDLFLYSNLGTIVRFSLGLLFNPLYLIEHNI